MLKTRDHPSRHYFALQDNTMTSCVQLLLFKFSYKIRKLGLEIFPNRTKLKFWALYFLCWKFAAFVSNCPSENCNFTFYRQRRWSSTG